MREKRHMGNYSIKDLERLSGVKAHTIRIWEQRYGIIQPQRTHTNIRYYSNTDLRRLLNISLLNQHGYKISRIAKMTDAQLYSEIRKATEAENPAKHHLAALTLSLIEMDEGHFEKLLATHISSIGFEKTMTEVIFPFLEHVRIMWMTDAITLAQEHFISNIIRQKLVVAIDGQPAPETGPEHTFLLFCPEDEHYELGLLFMAYLLRSRRKKVVYLGTNVPLEDLYSIYEIPRPQYLCCYITATPTDEELQQFIHNLCNGFPESNIWLAGPQLFKQELDIPPTAKVIRSFAHVTDCLDNCLAGSFHNN